MIQWQIDTAAGRSTKSATTLQKLGVRIGRSPNRWRSPRKSGGGVCGGGSVSPSPESFWNFELQIVQSGI